MFLQKPYSSHQRQNELALWALYDNVKLIYGMVYDKKKKQNSFTSQAAHGASAYLWFL